MTAERNLTVTSSLAATPSRLRLIGEQTIEEITEQLRAEHAAVQMAAGQCFSTRSRPGSC
jgi:hypothetical protein